MSKATIAVAVLTMSACAGQGGSPTGHTTPGTNGDPAPDQVKPHSNYKLQSEFDLTLGSLAPAPAYELLQDLDQDPGAALVSLAEAAGVPAAGLLFDALPSSLSGKVEGWMSDAIASSSEVQVLMAWSQTVLTQMEVRSTLALGTLDAEGHGSATHSLDALSFQIDGKLFEQAIPGIAELPGAGHSELELWVDRDAEGLHLVFGEQRFGLLFGEAAYRAFESAVAERYGTDLRGVLGNAIGCPAMAEEVANQCVLSVCVGHKAELQSLCEGALDKAVDSIHEQFAVLDAEVLRLSSGEALIVSGESADRTALQAGQWKAAGDFGLGLRDLPARFSGESIP